MSERFPETEYFSDPGEPGTLHLYIHEHEWFEIGAQRASNGVWYSVWACELCPDIGEGGKVGPIPPGYCPCGWVQKKWPRKKCEDCKREMRSA